MCLLARLRSGITAGVALARGVYIKALVRPPVRQQRGFTLVETMVTLAIISTGMLGLMAMQLASVRGVQNAAEMSLATNLAASALDELTLVDYATLQSTGITSFPRVYDKQGADVAATASNIYFTVTATVQATGGSYVDVRVQTTWKNELSPSANRVITLNGRVRQRGS